MASGTGIRQQMVIGGRSQGTAHHRQATDCERRILNWQISTRRERG